MKSFTETLFDPKNVVVKTIEGKSVTGEELLECFNVINISHL